MKPSEVVRTKVIANQFNGGFGKAEVEVAVGMLVQFLAANGDNWAHPFSFRQLFAFYTSKDVDPNEMLFGLIGPWVDDMGGVYNPQSYIMHWGNGLQVTPAFVRKVGGLP